MEREELKAMLSQLQQQLQSGEPIDAETAARLQKLSAEVSHFVGHPEGAPPLSVEQEEGESLLDRLLGVTQEFEETHPSLAEAIGRIASALSRIGI